MFSFWETLEDTPPPPARSSVFVMRNGRYEPQNLMPVLPRPDILDFDGFVLQRGSGGRLNARPPEMRQANLFKVPVNVRRGSAKVAPATAVGSEGQKVIEGPGTSEAEPMVLSLVLDTLRPCRLSLLMLVSEVEHTSLEEPPEEGGVLSSSREAPPPALQRRIEHRVQAAGSKLPDEQQPLAQPIDEVSFDARLGQVYVSPPLRLDAWPLESLSHSSAQPREIPFVVRLEAEKEGDEEPCTHFTYISLNKAAEADGEAAAKFSWCAQTYAQKLQYGSQCLVLHEVFGAHSPLAAETEQEGGNPECVICLSEPRDTAVLPCRHMCFCHYCAGIVRLQCDRCPVCRQKVASLLQFKRDEPEEAKLGKVVIGGAPPAASTLAPAEAAQGK